MLQRYYSLFVSKEMTFRIDPAQLIIFIDNYAGLKNQL